MDAAYDDQVETPLGRLTCRVEIDQADPKSPTGRWRGVQWSSEGGSPEIKLAVEWRESGDRVIYDDQTLFLLYR